MKDGMKQLRLAVGLLWAGVALGAVNLGLHAWLGYRAGGQVAAASPLILTAALFILVQGRLILALHAGNFVVRKRLLVITLLRLALLVPQAEQILLISPLLVILPAIGALLQLGGLALVYAPPASQRFARPAPLRP
jgi:hypothetical protein